MNRILLFVAGLCLMPALASAQSLTCSAGHLVSIAPDGTVSSGSKDALRDAFRAGRGLRVGWALDATGDGVPEVSHWADAAFLTEWQGEIFAQVHDIQRQAPRPDPARIEMPQGRQRWSGLLGTTGVLESHFDDGTAARSMRVPTTWCLASCPPPSWRLVYRHDGDGRALEGAKDALLAAVRRGSALRFAWGFAVDTPDRKVTVEHTAEPVFVTIAEGEVIVQLPEHIGQASYHEAAKARLGPPSVMWRALMSTTGAFDAVWVDRATGEEVRRLPQRAGLAWFALEPEPGCAAAPLTLAVPGGVRREP